jgi:hypothetical protein
LEEIEIDIVREIIGNKRSFFLTEYHIGNHFCIKFIADNFASIERESIKKGEVIFRLYLDRGDTASKCFFGIIPQINKYRDNSENKERGEYQE